MMKKAFAALTVLLGLGFSAQAQINITPKVGLSINNMDMKGSGSFYPTVPGIKPMGGIGLGILFSEELSIQSEFHFVQKGYTINSATANGQYLAKEVYNQLEIPLLARYTFADYNSGVNGFIHAGPFWGYYLNGSYQRSIEGAASKEGNIYFKPQPEGYFGADRYMYGNYVSRTELGFQFGGGTSIVAGPGSIVLDARYSFGITSMYRKTSEESSGTGYGKSRGVVLMLGYTVPIIKTKQATVQITHPGKPPRKPKKQK